MSHMEKLKRIGMINATHKNQKIHNGLVVMGGTGLLGTFYIKYTKA